MKKVVEEKEECYRLKINNLEWTIKFIPETDKLLDNASGITYRMKDEIYIGNNYKDDLTLRVIQHELTHACVWSYGLDATETGKNWNEEEICQFVESHGKFIIDEADKILKYKKGLDKKCQKKKII